MTGLSLDTMTNDGTPPEVHIVAIQGGVETTLGSFVLCYCDDSVVVPISSFSFAPGKAEIRIEYQGEPANGYYAVDNIHMDYCGY